MKPQEFHTTPIVHPARKVIKTTLFLSALVLAMLAMSAAHAQDIDCDSAKPVAAYLHPRTKATSVRRHGPALLHKPAPQVGCTRESLHGFVPVALESPVPVAPIAVVPPVAPVPVADVTPTSAIAAASPSGFPMAVGGGALLLGAVLCITYHCGESSTAGRTTSGTTGTTGTN